MFVQPRNRSLRRPWVKPTALAQGITARSMDYLWTWPDTNPATVGSAGVLYNHLIPSANPAEFGAVVIEVEHGTSNPTGTAFSPAWVAQHHRELDKVAALGLKARIRFRGGYRCAQWVRDVCGSMPWATREAPDPAWDLAGVQNGYTYRYLPNGIPITWGAEWRDIQDSCHAEYAAEFGGHSAIAETVSVMMQTQYAEPVLIQSEFSGNSDQAIANGYTVARHKWAIHEGWRQHWKYYSQYKWGCFTPFNPMCEVKVDATRPSGLKVAAGATLGLVNDLIDKQVEILGGLAVPGNCSYVENESSSLYNDMYDRMSYHRVRSVPTAVQTETKAKQLADGATIQGTIERAITNKMHSVEIAIGVQLSDANPLNQLTPAEAAGYSAQMRAQTAADLLVA